MILLGCGWVQVLTRRTVEEVGAGRREQGNAEEMPDSAQGTGDWRESTQQGGWPLAIDSVPQCPKLTRDNGSNSARHSVCPLGGEDSIPAAGDGGKGAGMMSSLLFLA